MVEVLEHVRIAEVRQLLAGGAPGAWVAQTTLDRLGRR
jgi:hypothetical protein